jgi:hypothetical protein
MSFAVFKGETNMKDLINRLFTPSGKGSQAKADQAAKILVQANPQLKDLSKVLVGSVINIPATAPALNASEEVQLGGSSRAAITLRAQQSLEVLSRRLSEIDARAANGAAAFLALAQSTQAQSIAQTSPELKDQLTNLITSAQAAVTATNASQGEGQQAGLAMRTSLVAFAQGKNSGHS